MICRSHGRAGRLLFAGVGGLLIAACLLLRANAADDSPSWRPFAGQRADGQLELFSVDEHGELRHRWQRPSNGDWSSWSSLGGTLFPSIAIANGASGCMDVFGIDKQTHSLVFIQQQTPT